MLPAVPTTQLKLRIHYVLQIITKMHHGHERNKTKLDFGTNLVRQRHLDDNKFKAC